MNERTESTSSGSRNRSGRRESLQKPRDVAVVMPTLLRPTILRAVDSVFRQDFSGTIHLVIGIDAIDGDPGAVARIRETCPANVTVTVFDPGFSTARRHGGIHPAGDGGALRTILSYLANAPRIAYLDDDNWWAPDHLSSLTDAIEGRGWAFSYRWFVDPATGEAICEDRWESVGPGRGVFAEKAGGFVDPNTLMIDKTICEPVLRWWSVPMFPQNGTGADRNVFNALRTGYGWAATGRASAYYLLQPGDRMQPYRDKWIADWKAGQAGAGT